jgi:hypothetical protein
MKYFNLCSLHKVSHRKTQTLNLNMKQFFLLCYFAMIASISFGQIKAVTSNGDEVILNDDKTWKYVDVALQNQDIFDTNKLIFSKPTDATFVVKSKVINCGVYLDPKKWSFVKSKSGEDSEYEFTLKGKDGYALTIAEKSEIPLETLGIIAFDNAKEIAPDMAIVRKEYRNVNGNTVLSIHMRGTTKGMKITYFAYYFSSPKGAVQLLTYCTSNLFEGYKNEFEELLNGFVLMKE